MFAGYYPAGCCAEVNCFKNFGFLLNNELTDFNFIPRPTPIRPTSIRAPTMSRRSNGRAAAWCRR